MKLVFRKVFNSLSRLIFSVFYDRSFFTGKYFQNNASMGYIMCWKFFFFQKIIGDNRKTPWPVSNRIEISNPSNIDFHPDDMQNFWHFGCYYQNFSAKIIIGRGTYIAPNVGIITANHDTSDLSRHETGKNVVIGEKCWIGMNSVILPGVVLGPKTVVGAGAVVTKSFELGNVVIGGNPAKVLRRVEDNDE